MAQNAEPIRTRPGPQPRAVFGWGGGGLRAALLAPTFIGLAWLAGCARASAEGGDPGAPPLGEAPLADTAPSASLGPWLSAAPMSVGRANHTATRLLDGRVLVAGGETTRGALSAWYDSALSSAEVYDPATGAWTAAASMGSARSMHTATLLSNGKVLVVGGGTNGGHTPAPLAAAEIYDPAANVWTAVPPMDVPRLGHTATPLPDGRVLVAGGSPTGRSPEELASCAIYDPALNAWSAGGSMHRARSFHAATLLLDGKVFVSGGIDATAETYDPAADAWTPGTPMLMGLRSHTAMSLPGGEVLSLDTAAWGPHQIYSPATGTWRGLSMSGWEAPYSIDPSDKSAVQLADGRALLSGGVTVETAACGTTTCQASAPPPVYFYYDTVGIYDAATDSWSMGPNMSQGRADHAATLLLDGTVLVTGGFVYGDGTWNEYATNAVERLAVAVDPGAPCGSSVDCGGRSCVDGVCCDTACDGACEACSAAAGATQDGVCSPLTGPACDDGNACTEADACEAGACAGAPVGDGAPCDDGNACTEADACEAGACAGAPASDGAPCDDGDACTQTDACAAGACAGADPVACAAPADGCQAPFCDPATGRCESALAPWGAPCDDGSACTQGDTCAAGACIGGTPTVVCDPSGPCRASACDAATGACVESVPPDGTPCEDGDACTEADTCQAGSCAPGAPKVCPVLNSCHTSDDVCQPSTGYCGAPPPLPDGTSCPDPTTSAWVPAAPVPGGLYPSDSSTLLPDGTVLVAGGEALTPEGRRSPLSRAVRYDPASGTWAPAGAMLHARSLHTATLLPDGTVLVAGGTALVAGAPAAIAEAERYDPATGVWTAAAPMNVARRGHAAALLPNGNLLVAGGFNGSPGQRSAELYDPVANTWTLVASMNDGRALFSATPLLDGRVLVVGSKDPDISPHPEVYDPSTDSWTAIWLPSWQRDFWHSATRLADGRVLIVNRSDTPSEYAVHLFDPSDDTWSEASPADCVAPSAVLLADGRVLVLRCWAQPPESNYSAVQIYDPETDTWSPAPNFAEEPGKGDLVRLADGRVLLTATCPLGSPDCSALLYVPGDAAPGDGICERGVCMPRPGGAGGEGGSGGSASASGAGGGGSGASSAGGGGGTSSAGGGTSSAGGGGTSSAGGGGTGGSPSGAGGDASGAGSTGSTSSAGGGGTGGSPSGAGGAGDEASAQGSTGASTPGGAGDAGGCSTARLPGGASGAPWLLLLSLLGARRQAFRRRAPRARLDG
ncbi:kelch repeat-containing protein [Sorangium sp. So ce861]|uniref:Kelch repeat-containing protein n=1 Tax=Sorangium sp. So ce861 TaxID=3133323 RepID=UPI003F5EA9FD